jgi:ketosteroid isomerase-like protein
MKNLLILVLGMSMIASCNLVLKKPAEPEVNMENEDRLQEMVDTDKAFSAASEKNGMKKAFLEYIADDAVLLRPGFLPIVEGDVIRFLNAQEDTSFTMTWEPKGADIAASGDLGFTYGVYKVATADTVLQGTYLNIWRKQADGSWKFVVDTGNQGISFDTESMQ